MSQLTVPKKTAQAARRRKKKDLRKPALKAIVVGLVLGAAFAAVVFEAPQSVVFSYLSVIFAIASFLVAAAATERATTGFLCGVGAIMSYLMILFVLYASLWTVGVGLDVAVSEARGIIVSPLAGAAGGYIVRRTL